MPGDKPAMRDIAEAAGVSIATVSRVLSGGGPASEDARTRVLAVASELGYRLDDAARTLRTNRSRTIGALVFDLQNEPLIDLVRGAHRVANANGYQLVVCDGHGDPEVQRSNLDWLERHRVEGLLIAGSPIVGPERLAALAQRGIPIAPAHISSSQTSGERRMLAERDASIAAFEHLQALGHRRIGVVLPGRHVSEGTDPTFLARVELLRGCLAEAGESLADDHVIAVGDHDAAVDHLAAMVASPQPPTALVVATIAIAPYVMGALGDLGVRVPDDLSVVVYGESRWSRSVHPTLSTIRRDTALEGERFLANLIESIDRPEHSIDYEHEIASFVPRGSSGPAPGAGE